jgi:hypothetical protein
MSWQTLARLLVPACLLAASATIVVASHSSPTQSAQRPGSPVASGPPIRAIADHRRPDTATAPAEPPRTVPPEATAAAVLFVRGWLRCVYRRAGCSVIPAILPTYATLVVPELEHSPVTHADLSSGPRLLSITLARPCRYDAVATASYQLGGRPAELHPSLVREPDGWQVFSVAEYPLHITLPSPLRPGMQPC